MQRLGGFGHDGCGDPGPHQGQHGMDLRQLLDGDGRHVFMGAQFGQHVAEIARAFGGIHDQRLAVEILQRQRHFGQARIAKGQRRDKPFAGDLDGGELAACHRWAQQADIDAAGEQAFHLLGADHLLQVDIDVGRPRRALQQQVRQEAVAGHRGEAQGDGAGLS